MTQGLSPLACSSWIDIAAGACHACAAPIAARVRWRDFYRPYSEVRSRSCVVETVSDLSEFLARCPSCESVLLRMVPTFDALWLDMSGMSALRILMMINSTRESYSR
jgi:hypothetical protein